MFKKTITLLIALISVGSVTAQTEKHHRVQHVSLERALALQTESVNRSANSSNAEYGFTVKHTRFQSEELITETSLNEFSDSTFMITAICWSIICFAPIITVLILHFRFQAKNRKWRNSLVTKNGIL